MKCRFPSRRMRRVAARAGASDHSSALERRLGMGILAVAPRHRVRDAIAELDAAIAKAKRITGRRFSRRRTLTPIEREARYQVTLERIYRHRWSLRAHPQA